MNLYLGQYVGAGVNDPKHYPKQSALEHERERKLNTATTDESRKNMARLKYGKAKNGHD